MVNGLWSKPARQKADPFWGTNGANKKCINHYLLPFVLSKSIAQMVLGLTQVLVSLSTSLSHSFPLVQNDF